MARAGGGMGSAVNVGIAVQADWENREFISNISLNVRRLFDFLLRFGKSNSHSVPSFCFFFYLDQICSC
ncbi:hypothetical protein BRADI_1g03890v3 [Brachypodium distachyon]|uniref:Uncharacterized protein n=1 Tax=Brachypodium distachyon TaxID=15368 RepID=I1GLL6_BRADI|nr:hypothetical protein BRADI_1g03890v3 [Brachypodium distachyon]